ncbi:hypothetical protein I2I05_12325 [Hymenobacter sp. BT683]|uniref:YfhO family protein n=1 Tax=Hymenobacter jeongseonensis TaxID=2791027 RepID=A0ABS0IJ48_9BACT|nr:DUF6056 family protein [Hymenobacter jeongseonensis]MBF9238182.1 hypothetical protein [Hymenobacter jeongseonensis]
MIISPTLRILLLRLGLLLAIAPFLLLTAFNQPFFDDFRNAYWTRAQGMWGVQQYLFNTWTGRFTSTFFMTVLNPVTYGWLGGVKVVAAGLFVVQWASIAHFFRALLHTALRVSFSWGAAFWAAGLLLALFCNGAPAPFSYLYWFCGAVAYQIPLIGLLNFTALALRAGWGPEPTRWRCAGLACLPLVLALVGNELTLVQAVPVLALLGYALPVAARPKWWLWLAIGGLATAVAVVAPGNWLRARAMAPEDALQAYRWLVLLPRTAYSALLFLARPVTLLSVLAAAAAGWWLGLRHRGTSGTPVRLSRRAWWAVLAAFVVLNGIGFLLFRYLIVGAPLMRAQNEILLVMLVAVAALAWVAAQHFSALGYQVPLWLRHEGLLALLAAGLFASGHVPEAWRELLTSAPSFDTQMQARFTVLRTAQLAQTPVVVLPPLRLPYGHVLIPLRQFSTFIEFDIDLTAGCEGNINGVMERYFQVADVCCEPTATALPAPQ